MICSRVQICVGVYVCVCAGMPPLERWPFSREQTRHLSKVLHHLREDSVEMCFARLSLLLFSVSL